MKRRTGQRGWGLGLAAGAVTALALLPLYGDPRPSPITHPEWARMILRAMDLLDKVPPAEQASQVFATLSWKNSLSYRADRYMKGAGVTVLGDEPARRVQASAEVGEVSYPIAVARGGDYRVRLLLAGSPAQEAETEIRAFGEDKPQKVFTVPTTETAAWADAGRVHLDPGGYSATVLLPKGASLEYVELAPPCLNPIEPLGGWKGQAIATTGDVAVTALKAVDLEHELPPSDTALEIPADEITAEGGSAELEASYGAVPGLAGLWLKAGPKGLDASVFLDLAESGLYSVSVFGVTGGGLRVTADSCRKSVLCAEPSAAAGPHWRQVFSGEFGAGRHFLTLNLGRGAALQRIRVERKKDAAADYLATVRRLGLDLGAEGPDHTRERRCGDEVHQEPPRQRPPEPLPGHRGSRARARGHGGGGTAVTPPGGPGTGPGTGPGGPSVEPVNPIGPPVIPPQEVASPTVPN